MDIEKLRADTPGIDHCVNLNSAGASLMPAPVLAVQEDYLRLEGKIGGQAAARAREDEIASVRRSIAALLNTEPGAIALTTSATRAWQLAFYGLRFQAGDRIVTSRAEYGSNYVAFLHIQKRTGCVIDVIPDDESGASDPQALDRMIDERCKLVAITWVPTNGGLVNPAAEIGRIARRRGVPYLLDACQAIGQISCDVNALNCDFLCATGRKWLRGPRGSGFLYVAPAMLDRVEPAVLDHAGARLTGADTYELLPDAGRYQAYERPYGAALGLGAAVDYALALGLDGIGMRVAQLAAGLRRELAARQQITVRDLGANQCGIVTFTHDRLSSVVIRDALARAGIQVSVSPPDGTPLDAAARGLDDLVRVSPHYYTSDEDLALLLTTLDAMA